jgi:hypothetical protein
VREQLRDHDAELLTAIRRIRGSEERLGYV